MFGMHCMDCMVWMGEKCVRLAHMVHMLYVSPKNWFAHSFKVAKNIKNYENRDFWHFWHVLHAMHGLHGADWGKNLCAQFIWSICFI